MAFRQYKSVNNAFSSFRKRLHNGFEDFQKMIFFKLFRYDLKIFFRDKSDSFRAASMGGKGLKVSILLPRVFSDTEYIFIVEGTRR